LELEKKCIAVEEASEKEAAVRKRRKTPKIIHSDWFSSRFGILQQAP